MGNRLMASAPGALEVLERIVFPEKSRAWTFQDVESLSFQTCFSRKRTPVKPPRKIGPPMFPLDMAREVTG